jgi:hypothetical protein
METLDFFFFETSVASLDESFTKNERNRICRSKLFPQLSFSSFFCFSVGRVSMIASASVKKVQSFHEVQS